MLRAQFVNSVLRFLKTANKASPTILSDGATKQYRASQRVGDGWPCDLNMGDSRKLISLVNADRALPRTRMNATN